MDDSNMMFVDFARYCPKCEHKELEEAKDPCNDCLAVGARVNSEKPEFFKEKE